MPNPGALEYTHRFFVSLLATTLIEGLVVLLIFIFLMQKRAGFSHLKKLQVFLVGMSVSVCTLPYVWYVFPTSFSWPRETSLQFSEPFIFVFEVILYRFLMKIPWKWAFLLSLLANLASYFIPMALRSAGWWMYF